MFTVLSSSPLYLILSLCIVATCPDLVHSIENGGVSYSRDPTEQGLYVENTTVTVSCDEGYRGGGNITCQRDGNWSSSSLPNCTSKPVVHVAMCMWYSHFIYLPVISLHVNHVFVQSCILHTLYTCSTVYC